MSTNAKGAGLLLLVLVIAIAPNVSLAAAGRCAHRHGAHCAHRGARVVAPPPAELGSAPAAPSSHGRSANPPTGFR